MKPGWIVEKYENGPVFGYKVCEPVAERGGITIYRERFIVKTRETAQFLADVENEGERLDREIERVNGEIDRYNQMVDEAKQAFNRDVLR